MQVKKFEAPTLQEALDQVKQELGPEAIILQTRKNKKGFGILSQASVEVTAAISERSLIKKQKIENRIPEKDRQTLNRLPADKQANLYEKYHDRNVKHAQSVKERVEVGQKKITATRYIDIEDAPSREKSARNSLGAMVSSSMSTYERSPARSAPNPPPPPSTRDDSRSGLEDEVKQLKKMIEEMKTTQAPSHESFSGAMSLSSQAALDIPALQDAFDQLVTNGVERRYALALVKKAAFDLGTERARNPEQVSNRIAQELLESFRVHSPFESVLNDRRSGRIGGPAVFSFIGPTGVGKTTTLAKIASEAQMKRHLKVGLINLDYFKITAFDQLATYGKILHVPFRSVSTIEDLKVAISDFQNLDLILVDTTGRSHRDHESLQEVQKILSAVPLIRNFLVLSATTRDSEMMDAASRFTAFHPEGLVISKLDEVVVYGGLYNLAQKVNLPFLYFTTGQRVPDDIELATRERLVSLLMGF